MGQESAGYRWWESYLVRYFLPSVAGMIIVQWLAKNTGGTLNEYMPFLLKDWKELGTSHLILWLLFGTLYCYIASYLILVFHATRVLDFKGISGNVTSLGLNPHARST